MQELVACTFGPEDAQRVRQLFADEITEFAEVLGGGSAPAR